LKQFKKLTKKLSFAWQRKTKGFAPDDLWNLDQTIARFVLPRLKEFRRLYGTIPVGEENLKQWHETIDKMIFAMETISDESYPFSLSLNDSTEEKVQDGLNLFAKHFMKLWD
jgi:hypothetical protein